MVTANYNFNLPAIGADKDVWGTSLNDNWTSIDTLLKASDDRITVNESDIAALQQAVFPVGAIYITTNPADPSITLGFGTWVATAAGRAIIGVGDNGEQVWAAAEKRGAEVHQLSATEMPLHSHTMRTQLRGSASGTLDTVVDAGAGVSTSVEGGTVAHNNVQPSEAFYVWERTA